MTSVGDGSNDATLIDGQDALQRLVIGHDGDGSVLGRPDLGVYVAVPEAGAALIEALQSGATVEQATARASEVAGTAVDGADFLAGLTAAGLLDDSGGSADTPAAPKQGRQIRWVEGVSPRTAGRLFGRWAWSFYALAAATAATVLVGWPGLRPSFEHAWWLTDPIASMLLLYPIGLVLAALHEGWHWLAGRAVGVPAIFRVSYRGAYLVFETDLTQIVGIPRRRRYGPFLAGMAIDCVVMAIALVLRLANRYEVVALPGLVDRLLAAIVLLKFVGVVWQFAAIFMRSDMYAVLANALRCHDLYRATWLTTKDRLRPLTVAESAELADMTERDRGVARYFGLFYLAGMVAVSWMLLHFTIPFVIGVLVWVGGSLTHPDLGSWTFWSSLAAAVLVVGQRLAPPLLALRERRLRRAGGLR